MIRIPQWQYGIDDSRFSKDIILPFWHSALISANFEDTLPSARSYRVISSCQCREPS